LLFTHDERPFLQTQCSKVFHFIDHPLLRAQNRTALEFFVPSVNQPLRPLQSSSAHAAPAHAHLRRALLFAVLLSLALLAIGCGGKKRTARNVPPAPSLPDRTSPSAVGGSHPVPSASVPGIHVDPNAKVIWTEVGYASWYGPNYHNKKAANGELYNQNEMTAAHNTLPLNSIVRVVNLSSNQSTVVRITDRGPFVGDRIIDLSVSAAKAVNVYLPGTARVRLDVLEAPHPIETGGRWCVQIGAFQSEADAITLKQRLLDRYPGSQVLEFKGPTGYWVRIRVARDDKEMTRNIYEHTHVEEGGVFMVRLD
jgi:rare lipoprotein A